MRFIQHKKEAYWFYRFLSIFYDKLVNPLFWTEPMRDSALELAELDSQELTVVDVGSGTGFTTEGIVQQVPATQVSCVDQSPHQMAKAKKKPALADCHFQLGDAEQIPHPSDHFDRYVSAGSIEYWPHPQQGVCEAYRVIKPGGVALLIGPLEPQNGFARLMARVWMLFPPEKAYREWFEKAGFSDIQVRFIRPQWYRRQSEYGIAIAGKKPQAGHSPAHQELAESASTMSLGRRFLLIIRVLIGSLAGFVFIPIALTGYLIRSFSPRPADAPRERLNGYQILAIGVILLLLISLGWWFFS